MSQLREVAMREIRTRSRTRSFRLITAIMVVLAIGGPIVASLIPDDDDERREVTVGVVDLDIAPQVITEDLEVTFVDLSGSSAAEVDEAVGSGDVDAALAPGPTLVWDEAVDFQIAGVLVPPLQQIDAIERGEELGLSPQETAELVAPPIIEERFVEPTDEEDDIKRVMALIGLMMAFIMPQVFGQLTLLSVVEEKSTRVVEVLLGQLRPRTLLLGKVLGLSALAIVQLALLVGGLTAALVVVNAIEIPAAVWRFLPILVVSVLGGLAIYNTLFALLGSLISRQEDASQVLLPTFVPLIGGYFVGQAAIVGDASSTLVQVLTCIPLTAPMMLPVRVARDAIAGWEVAVSIALIVVGVWLLMRLAGRIYEFTLLRTGSRVGWGEALRLSRGAVVDGAGS